VKQRRNLADLERKTLVLHTSDGQSFRGVLLHMFKDSVVLCEVEHLDGDVRVELAGHVVIPRPNVSWLQVTA